MEIQGYNILMIRGDTETIKVLCQDIQGNAVPFNIGDILYFTMKKDINVENKILQKIITEFVDGVAYINISPNDTKAIVVGSYYYDIQLTKVDGTVKTIIPPSMFSIRGEVTYE